MTYNSRNGSKISIPSPLILRSRKSTLSFFLISFTSLLIQLTWLFLQIYSSFVQLYLSVLQILSRIQLRFQTRVLSAQSSPPVRLLSILMTRQLAGQGQFTVWEAVALPELQVSQISDPKLHIAPNSYLGCSISLAKGYSYGVTWGVGAQLGLTIAEVIDAGITGGVYWTETTSTTETVTVECPDGDNYVCGMAFSASMLYITGKVIVNSTGEVQGEVCNLPSNPEYAVEIPETTGGSAPLPIFRAWACSCTGKSSLPACTFNCNSSSQ